MIDVPAAPIPVAPPRKLGKPGQALWDRVQSAYHIEDAGGVELLAQGREQRRPYAPDKNESADP
jgi:hypothetical protein